MSRRTDPAAFAECKGEQDAARRGPCSIDDDPPLTPSERVSKVLHPTPTGNGTAHARCVEEWLARRGAARASPRQNAELVVAGLRAVWERARPTLGEVTLAVVFHRAVATIEKAAPPLQLLRLRVTESAAVEIDVLDPDAISVEAVSSTSLVLIEVLKVLDRLTAGMLTAGLHDALAVAGTDVDQRRPPRSPIPSSERPDT